MPEEKSTKSKGSLKGLLPDTTYSVTVMPKEGTTEVLLTTSADGTATATNDLEALALAELGLRYGEASN